jgi:hypothetical protein
MVIHPKTVTLKIHTLIWYQLAGWPALYMLGQEHFSEQKQ